jgi:dihydrofolate synthase / folylpolyglutamate synthase
MNPDVPSAQYQWALQFLDQRIDFERFQTMPGPEREIKLDRMRALLDRLGNPQDKLPIIHVAGTKGKGSTSAMIASILQAAGYRTGLFTSPHLEKIEERIAVDSQPCTADEFVALVAAVQPVVEAMDQKSKKGTDPFCRNGPKGALHKRGPSPFYGPDDHGPTYFEIITAMALLHFVQSGVQAAVLEVGLGGRLDSTNVCRPLVSVITSISFDHTQQLGDTLQSIAREKAGIIKPGVPVISGVTDDEPRSAIRQIARDCACRLVELNQDFRFDYHPPLHLEKQPAPGAIDFSVISSPLPLGEGQGEGGAYVKLAASPFPLALLGRHQAANAAVALATIHELISQGWNISEQSIRQGLATVRWPARIEIVARQPVVILDSAHNSASIAALVEVIKESFSVKRRLLLFATTRDKDHEEMLKLLLAEKGDAALFCESSCGPSWKKNCVPFFDEIVFTQYTTNPRALPFAELEAIAFKISGRHYPIFPTPPEAWKNLRQSAAPDDLICITGSFFLAGEMRKLL